MERLNEILHELGISKVKLSKYLGVSRQMIYNYLELDDINKWPKDKKVLLLNLLGIKSAEELDNIKVDTDYILEVESRIEALFDNNKPADFNTEDIYNGLDDDNKKLLASIIDLLKEKVEEDSVVNNNVLLYLNHFLRSMDNMKELKYILAYISKSTGFTKPLDFVFNEEEQFVFESIMYSAMTLYNNKESISSSKIAESHKRFVDKIELRREEKIGRTMALNSLKVQALKELGYTEINDDNAAEVLEKIAEIESRNIN